MVVVYFMMIPVIIGAIHGTVAIYHNPWGDTSVHLIGLEFLKTVTLCGQHDNQMREIKETMKLSDVNLDNLENLLYLRQVCFQPLVLTHNLFGIPNMFV